MIRQWNAPKQTGLFEAYPGVLSVLSGRKRRRRRGRRGRWGRKPERLSHRAGPEKEKRPATRPDVSVQFAVIERLLAEREAPEPVLSQNIMKSQMSINNQLITIIIKSKYY